MLALLIGRMANATPRVLAEEAVLDDSIAFGRSRLPLVRVLLCAVPWSALLFVRCPLFLVHNKVCRTR